MAGLPLMCGLLLLGQGAIDAKEAAPPRGPLVTVEEQQGRLRFLSPLAEGKHVFDWGTRGGFAVAAEFVVGAGDAPRTVSSLRLTAHGPPIAVPETDLTPARNVKPGFTVELVPSPVDPEKFSFRVEVLDLTSTPAQQSSLFYRQTPFGLTITLSSRKLSGHFEPSSLIEWMLDRPDGQLVWEQIAQHASLPEIRLTPHSRYSPTALEQIVSGRTQPPPPIDAALGHRLLARLDDIRFEVRQTAAREMLALGEPLLPFLETLNRNALSLEQQLRVRELIRALANAGRRLEVLSYDELQALAANPPTDWLVQLVLARDDRTRDWAAAQLRARADFADLPLRVPLGEREAWIAKLRGRLPKAAGKE